MQLIHFLSMITALSASGALALPALPLDEHQATPVKREPSFPIIKGISYEKTAPKPKPDPRPIHVKPMENPTTIVLLPWVTPRPKLPIVIKPPPKVIDPKIRYRSAAAADPDKPVHILPFPKLESPPVIEEPELEPEPEKKPQTTTTTTTTTTQTAAKTSPTPAKKTKWKWPAKVRPLYYQPGYGVN